MPGEFGMHDGSLSNELGTEGRPVLPVSAANPLPVVALAGSGAPGEYGIHDGSLINELGTDGYPVQAVSLANPLPVVLVGGGAGAQGPQGFQGAIGPQGVAGVQGAQGSATSISPADSSLTFTPNPIISTGTIGINFARANTWTAVTSVNLNAAPLPITLTGSVIRLAQADGTAARIELNAFGAQAFFTSVAWGGTKASPTALTTGTQIGGYNSYGYNDTNIVGPVATFRAFASENWASSGTKQGSYAEVATTLTGSATLAVNMRWENDGGVTVPNTVGGGSRGAGTINAAGGYYSTITDTGTNTVVTGLTLDHESNQLTSITSGFGSQILFAGSNQSVNNVTMGAIKCTYTNTVNTTYATQLAFRTSAGGAAPSTGLTVGSGISGATAGFIIGGLSSSQAAIFAPGLTPSSGAFVFFATNQQTQINAVSTNLILNVGGNPVLTLTATAVTAVQPVTATVTDTGLSNALTCLTLDHETSGTKLSIAAGFGGSVSLLGTDSTTASQTMGAINWTWTTPTHGSASSQIALQTISAGGSLSTGLAVGSGISGATGGVIIGGNAGSGAIWVGGVTPTTTNYGLQVGGSSTILNGPSSGNTVFIGNGGTTPFAFNNTTGFTTTIADATTNAVTTSLTLQHNCSTLSSTTANFGTGIAFNLGDTTTTNQNAAAINAVWSTATHASRSSQVVIQTTSNAGALSTGLTVGSGISGATGGLIIGGDAVGFGGIWANTLTPSSSNFAFACSSGQTFVNSPSSALNLGQGGLTQLAIGTSLITSGVSLALNSIGSGLQIKTGTNSRIGTGTLSGGTLTVANTSVTANTMVILSDTSSSVTNVGALTVTTSAGVGFTVTSTVAIDTSTFRWFLVESIP